MTVPQRSTSRPEGPPRLDLVAESVLDMIGNTPVVDVSKLSPNPNVRIFAKLEMQNPFGSVKDRIAKAIVDDAEARGALRSGMTLVEATAGNTGVGLARGEGGGDMLVPFLRVLAVFALLAVAPLIFEVRSVTELLRAGAGYFLIAVTALGFQGVIGRASRAQPGAPQVEGREVEPWAWV